MLEHSLLAVLRTLLTRNNADLIGLAQVVTAVFSVGIGMAAVVVSGLTAYINHKTWVLAERSAIHAEDSAKLAERTAIYQHLTSAASILTTMSLAFETPDLLRRRRMSAMRLLDERNRDQIDLCDSESVLDFLEQVAFLTRRGVLDLEMVWNNFSWHIERYYQAATSPTDLIAKARNKHDSPSLYIEIEWLREKLGDIRQETAGEARKVLTPHQIKEFLIHETNLIVDRERASAPRRKGRTFSTASQ